MTYCVNEYCYADMDYRGEPDIPLPVDVQWGDIGILSFFFFHIYDFLWCTSLTNMCAFDVN